VTRPRPHGLTRSVQDRLRNIARSENRPYAELLQLYALERFLYRLSLSPQGARFILKGALMMHVWEGMPSRPTRDIDLLGPVGITEAEVEQAIRDCLAAEVIADGIELDSESIRIRPIRVAELHVGFRANLDGFLARSELRFQIDVGTGDNVVPRPVRIDYPTLLDFPSPRIMAYTPYTTIAEKFEALVKLDLANTRMKDFFDLDLLAARLEFDGEILARALGKTFSSRGIELSAETPTGLGERFAQSPVKNAQWQAFVRKGRLEQRAQTLDATVARVRRFLMPVVSATANQETFSLRWPPGGPWYPKEANREET
jgi:Nucleotidyl transferase AbiEii toxin, Type IV TA system